MRHSTNFRILRTAAMSAAALALASCGGDGGCWNCVYSPPPPSELSLGLVAGDFTNSGHASLIATSTVIYNPQVNLGFLKSYVSTGSGTFAAPVLTADGDDPLYLATADLNGDALLDVVSASYNDGTLAVFFNSTQTPGTFSTPLLLPSPGASQVAIGDLNGDGLPDLVSADFGVSLFVQSSPGAFAAPISLYSGGANWVAVGDLNGDGAADVVLADNVGVKVLLHTGAPTATTFAAPVTVFTQTMNANLIGANIVAIADVNGDGLNDLVVTDPGITGGTAPTVSVLLQDPANKGQFLPAVTYPVAQYSVAQSLIVKDINGDGKLDIVIGGTEAVSVLLQNAASPGTFLASTDYPTEDSNEVAVADVNGDGLVDIVIGTGVTHTVQSGVITNNPGVLLQVAATPGTFSALQDLP